MLFLIYITDLGNAILSKPRLFADDTCLVLSNSSLSKLEDNCNKKLNNLKKWCNANKLKINTEKSAVVLVPPKFNLQTGKFEVTYNNNPITCLSSSKYRGVFIDDKLNFKSHIKHLVSKISRSIGILSKLRFRFNSPTLLLLYYSFVHSHLLFGIHLWGSTSQSLLSKLQKLQNKAIRIITNKKTKSHVTPQFYKLKILKIQDFYTYEIAKLMHQHSNQIIPACFSSLFTNLLTIRA